MALRSAPAARDARRLRERGLDLGEDGLLRARRDHGFREALDVNVGAPPLPALTRLERDQRVDAVGADELAVTERDQPGLALGRHVA